MCQEGLRKTTKNLSQYSLSLCRKFNLEPPKYEAGVLTTRPRCSEHATCITITLMMEILGSSETSVSIYQLSRCNVAEDSRLQLIVT
jgi:hypothetical protein